MCHIAVNLCINYSIDMYISCFVAKFGNRER